MREAAPGRGEGGGEAATDLLRVVAIALIVNSHLDSLYPVPALATGGAIGNALFFALSGYGLAASQARAPLGFPAWYRRRVCRIYPALLPAVLLFVAIPGRAGLHWGWREWTAQALWPTSYWFVGALMLFYALLFPLLDAGRANARLGVLAALFVPYLAWYLTGLDLTRYTIEGEGRFKWIHYFQVMLFGAWLAGRQNLLAGRSVRRDAALMVAVLTAYHGLLLLVAGGRAGAAQGITHALVYPLIALALRLAQSPPVSRVFKEHPGLRAAAGAVAGITLELYLVQGTVRGQDWVLGAPFPLNALVCWTATLAAAWLLHRAALLLARGVRCTP